jgi:hypothetical protein
MAIIGSILAIRAGRAKEKLKELGSFSEETAVKPEVLGEIDWLLTHPYAKIRGIRRTTDGRYFLESGK